MPEQDFDNDLDNRTRNLAGAIEDLEEDILAEAQARQGEGSDYEEVVPWVIEFRIVGTPDIIRAPVSETLLFGRLDENHQVYPQVDLGKHLGQKLGVSRKHALMIARDNRVTIEDMGSANGTYINGQQLKIRRPYRVREGDILQLGNLKLQVHFVVKPSIDDRTMHGFGNDVFLPRVAQGQQLLILDDNKDVCRILRFVSKRSGFEPVVVHTLQEAITAIDTQAIDGVVVEAMLQEGSGLDLVQYVRQQNAEKTVPIIAMGNDSGGYREGQAYQRGVDWFIAKPIAVDVLVEALGKLAAMVTP
ncbi:MAG: FHA domain-containing protein [Anaerolineae bacterium]|nr:FHA domain-containing protein [Anaerolineae bacterium]MDQ7034676.1 FHA domain-containing protein [Anaerolineae bacterium]